VLVLRELWCWLLKLTAILEELQGVRAELREMNERAKKPSSSTDGWPPIR
jgi:hypothetical protein